MTLYLIRRLLLLPLTLFLIGIVNFALINLAPGDPTTTIELSPEGGAIRRMQNAIAFGSDERWLQFREHYGLTLPMFFNTWPFTSERELISTLQQLATKQNLNGLPLSLQQFDLLRIKSGDQARYQMPLLLNCIQNNALPYASRTAATALFVRGGMQPVEIGTRLSPQQRMKNEQTSADNALLKTNLTLLQEGKISLNDISKLFSSWLKTHPQLVSLSHAKLAAIFFFDSRFFRYFSKVITLDFGSMRNDHNRRVVDEVLKRLKYSLTLSMIPLVITFVACQLFGMIMAIHCNSFLDYCLTALFLALYATPIFVVAPFLIEKIAIHHVFPFTNEPIPLSGFSSTSEIYLLKTSWGRFSDISRHIALPLIAILYGSFATQSRLARSAILSLSKMEYLRVAQAKGVGRLSLWIHHIGRNSAIVILTSLAGSLAVILSGSLIVETLFEINGFGKFFYDAVLNRDYNVIMFSSLAGSCLALLGYLSADIAYLLLDPRISFNSK